MYLKKGGGEYELYCDILLVIAETDYIISNRDDIMLDFLNVSMFVMK